MTTQTITRLEIEDMTPCGCKLRVEHGTDTYMVTGEKGKFITVYPEREMPQHPGQKYPWPVGIPWIQTAASHAVMLFRRDNGHI